MNTLIILQQMAVIAILVGIGIFMYKKNMIDDSTSKEMSAIVTDVCNLALVMSCILTGDIKATHKELLTAVGVAVVIYILLCVLGILIPKMIRVPDIEQKYYNLMTVYTNVGFIGIPVANLPLIQAEKTGEDTQILSRGIMVTTVVSFVTITVVMSLVI